MNRRNFIKASSLATASLISAPFLWGNSNKWKGANDRINVAVIGIGGQGKSHSREFSKLKNVEVAAICDVDENLFGPAVKELFTDRKLRQPKVYKDLRKLFEDKDIDAVSIVTPSHWQAYMGKDRNPGESGEGLGNHYQNFTDAIRANDPGNLTSPIEEGFYSCALIHIANISYRLGRTINFGPDTQTISNDEDATNMLIGEYREPYIIPKEI